MQLKGVTEAGPLDVGGELRRRLKRVERPIDALSETCVLVWPVCSIGSIILS
jgi:hypothetical protein